uniref:Uncharacterized protein n=1 Tax=Cacopsylla melanoneura TaxID=428564 RepID=A0A8D8ZIM5_9HEMI
MYYALCMLSVRRWSFIFLSTSVLKIQILLSCGNFCCKTSSYLNRFEVDFTFLKRLSLSRRLKLMLSDFFQKKFQLRLHQNLHVMKWSSPRLPDNIFDNSS